MLSFLTPKMALRYFVLGLVFSTTISIAFAGGEQNNQDAYKFMKEVCNATQDGENQDGPCVKQLEKLILQNNHNLSVRIKAENKKGYEEHKDDKVEDDEEEWSPHYAYFEKFETFKKMAQSCTSGMASDGTKFQRICVYVRQGGDGGYTDKRLYMRAVSCVLGYSTYIDLIDPQMIGLFRKSFQECRKGSGK